MICWPCRPVSTRDDWHCDTSWKISRTSWKISRFWNLSEPRTWSRFYLTRRWTPQIDLSKTPRERYKIESRAREVREWEPRESVYQAFFFVDFIISVSLPTYSRASRIKKIADDTRVYSDGIARISTEFCSRALSNDRDFGLPWPSIRR